MKRAFDDESSEGERPHSVPSEGVAELRKELIHELRQDLEPMIRKELIHELRHVLEAMIGRSVAEEVEHILLRKFNASHGGASLQHMTGSPARKFRLQFTTNPSLKTFTKTDLKDEHGGDLHVILIDTVTGQRVTDGRESLAKLEVVPLMGDFSTSEEEQWSAEEFEKHVAKPREGKAPLLVGDLKFQLCNGEGKLGQMYFTDNSSFVTSKTFRLGVRFAPDSQHGHMSVREGKSRDFKVIDDRGKSYSKRDTPSPTDDVWRLHNIRRNGPIHTKLRQYGIEMVKDFLLWHETRPEKLKTVCNMSDKSYQVTIAHAKKCNLGDKLYIYTVKQPPFESLVFKANYQVAGAVIQGRFVHLEMMDGIEKARVDGLVRDACNHWNTNVYECANQDLIMNGAIEGSLAENMVNVAAATQVLANGSSADEIHPALQEAVDASRDIEAILPLERTVARQVNVNGDAITEWSSQEDENDWFQSSDIYSILDVVRCPLPPRRSCSRSPPRRSCSRSPPRRKRSMLHRGRCIRIVNCTSHIIVIHITEKLCNSKSTGHKTEQEL